MDEGQAVTQRDPRSSLRRRFDEAWAAVKWHTYLLYCRTLYRPHMRLIHRFGWHWHTRLHPMGGPPMRWCQWCGDRQIDGTA